MATLEFIRKQDLEDFKKELFSELRRMGFAAPQKTTTYKQWIKSYEVRELLGISAGTADPAQGRKDLVHKNWWANVLPLRGCRGDDGREIMATNLVFYASSITSLQQTQYFQCHYCTYIDVEKNMSLYRVFLQILLIFVP